MSPFEFIVAGLAVWRVSHLFSLEDGPFDLVFRLRKAAGEGFFGKLLDCFYCTSIWAAVVPGWYFAAGDGLMFALYTLALSGFACILQQFHQPTSL